MKKIVINYLFNTSYQLLVVLAPFITTPYIARVLGPEQIGVNAYSLSITQIMIVIGMLGIPLYGNKQVAIYSSKLKKDLSNEFWSIYLMQFIGMLTFIIVYVIYSLSLPEFWMKVFLLQGFHLLGAMTDISWLLLGLQRFKETVTRNFIFKIVSILLIFLLVKEKNDIYIYITIISLTTLISQLVLWFSAKKYIFFSFNWEEIRLKKHFKPMLILFLPQILGQIYLSLDKVILNYYTSERYVGYYDQAMKIIKLSLTVVTSVSTVMLPSIVTEFSLGNIEKIKKYIGIIFKFMLFLTIPMVFGIFSIANNFVTWFLGSEFLQVAQLLKIISPIIIFIGLGNLFGVQILVSINQSHKLTLSILCGAIVSVLIGLIFVPKYGVYATAIATLVTEICVVLVQFWFVKKYIEIKKVFISFIKYILAATIMMFFIEIFNNRDFSPIIKTFIQVILGILVYMITLIVFKEKFVYEIKNKAISIVLKNKSI